jgi:aryl-alcohol dehydrogenase-like predicted oxidoreductase
MTFGEQNSEADAHAQLDYAISQGINLIDVAEMYPVPPRPETQGLTETYVGNWLAKRGNREKVVLASKVSGPSRNNDSGIRPNQALDRKNIRLALEASLKRLQTDHLDLYQVHWPQRPTNCFGTLGYKWTESAPVVTLLETLEALTEFQRAGKIRYIGVSNETAFGVMRYLQLAEKHELPRIVTIQNPYSLLNRSYEVGLAEVTQYEGVELLAYSCLAFGTLTGKYLNGAKPQVRAIRCSAALPATAASRRKKRLLPTWISPNATIWIRRRWRWPLCVVSRSLPAPCWAQRQWNS